MKHTENCDCPECTKDSKVGEKISKALASTSGNTAAVALVTELIDGYKDDIDSDRCDTVGYREGIRDEIQWLINELKKLLSLLQHPPCPAGRTTAARPGADDAPQICAWTKFEKDSNWYNTGCGHEIVFEENVSPFPDYKFCPYCGRKLRP